MVAKRILLINMGSLGDLHPFIALGLELQNQGAEVLVVSGEAYRQNVESAGLSFASVRPNLNPDDKEILDAVLDKKHGPKRLMRDYVFKHIEDTYRDLEKIAAGFDLMVAGTLCYFVPILSEKKKIPWVSVNLSPMTLWSAHDVAIFPNAPFMRPFSVLGSGFMKAFYNFGFWATRSWAKNYYELRKKEGLDRGPAPFKEGMHSKTLNLMLFSRHFAKPQPDWPEPRYQPGFLFYDAPAGTEVSEGAKSFLERGEAPVVFTMGSTASRLGGKLEELFVNAAKELSKHDRRSILVLTNEAKARWSIDDKNIFISSYEPYSKLFVKSSLIVHQGGIGTCAQAMNSGHPSLIVAEVNDQPDNGRHLKNSGAGDWDWVTEFSPDTLAIKITKMLNDKELIRLSYSMSQNIGADDGSAGAAQKILCID